MNNLPIIKIDENIHDLDQFLLNEYLTNNCRVRFDITNLKKSNDKIRSYFRRSVNYLRGISVINNHKIYYSNIKRLRNPLSYEFKRNIGFLNKKKTIYQKYSQLLKTHFDHNNPFDIFRLIIFNNGFDDTYIKKTFNNLNEANKVLNVIYSCNKKKIINIFLSQNYQKHLGHLRVLQNINLFKYCGFDYRKINNSEILEYGPGLGGFYPYAISLKAKKITIVDKNHAIRLMALLRGANSTIENRIGVDENLKIFSDFVIGVGILNIFDFDNLESYVNTVKTIDGNIKHNGIGGLWVTYDQVSNRRIKFDNSEVLKRTKFRDMVFKSLGWKKQNLKDKNLKYIGLDYNFNDNFGLYVKKI